MAPIKPPQSPGRAPDDTGKPGPPSLETLAAAAVILLEKLVNQTDQIEAALKRIVQQGDDTNTMLQRIFAQGAKTNATLEAILTEVSGADKVLTTIKLIFRGVPPMPPIIPGPVVLTQVGQQVVAEIVGYDQFGQVFSPTPDWSFTNDNEAAATLDAQTGIVTAVANGVANITGSVTSAEGVELTDTESVTVNVAAEAPVLSTIKVVFVPPAEGTAAKKKTTVRR